MGILNKIKDVISGGLGSAKSGLDKLDLDKAAADISGKAKNLAGDVAGKAKNLADTDNDGKIGLSDLKSVKGKAENLAKDGKSKLGSASEKIKDKL